MQNKVYWTKTIVNAIVGTGVWRLAHGVVDHNMEKEKTSDKIVAESTSIVLGMMASEVTKSYTDRKIDDIVAWWQSLSTAEETPIK